MKRLTIFLATALLTFGIGVFSWFANPFKSEQASRSEPLRIHVSRARDFMNESFPNPNYHVYEITVENVSDKTIQGFTLLYEDSYGQGFLGPCWTCKDQTLRPGETKLRSRAGYTDGLKIWVDEVRFAGD